MKYYLTNIFRVNNPLSLYKSIHLGWEVCRKNPSSWGVNNEKAIGIILDNFFCLPSFCLPFPVYILHKWRGHHELNMSLTACRYKTKQEFSEKGKWTFSQDLDLSKSCLVTTQSFPENRKTNRKEGRNPLASWYLKKPHKFLKRSWVDEDFEGRSFPFILFAYICNS